MGRPKKRPKNSCVECEIIFTQTRPYAANYSDLLIEGEMFCPSCDFRGLDGTLLECYKEYLIETCPEIGQEKACPKCPLYVFCITLHVA